MSDTITVGYDGSDSATEAVMWAAGEAQARHLPLRIVSCFEMPALAGEAALGWGAGEVYVAVREEADTNVARIAAEVTARFPELTFTSGVSAGPASIVLLEDAGRDDLVVVGASSHDGAVHWLGSTPRHLVHHSPCPVAVIRGSASRGRPDRVVVGVDGSAAADEALRWAGDEADRYQVELAVVHGWSYPYAPTDTRSNQARELTEIDAACALERAVESARARCGVEVSAVLVESDPVAALLDTVRDGDLLVVGSRGRGALRSRLFGSTVNSVLDAAAVPVVVVRAGERDGEASPTNTAATLAHV
jgi:nucleotide-binding universal stress UspA family protein